MIVGVALRVRKANEGETIEEFSKRTQNAVNAEFTAIINNIPVNKTLSSGQALKIGKLELYNEEPVIKCSIFKLIYEPVPNI